MRDVTQALLALLDEGGRGALATVIRSSGSTPQEPGARMLLCPDGRTVGTIGGGAIEHQILDELRGCVVDGRPRVIEKDLVRDLGMCCGGRMEVFVEPVEGRPRLVIFGAGHVGKAVAEVARTIGFRVTVVDDRDELNTEARFAGCARVLAEPAEAADGLAPTDRDWLLVVTHDHRLDEEALDTYARLPHAYLGVIGSRRKIYRILQRIAARRGVPPLDAVYAPVGLDIGAVSPEEIAVSIAAELVALRHGHRGPHMRALDDPALAKVLGGDLTPDAAARIPGD
ncbi:MAG TPA: XdhC/CoxI family protein [Sandaracinaceae bacterium LLY-WYZ-13_1]|nr:XdhC/CoxI family protein [Sandaracinaceae bacterium LLY-WYZ-13_1]